MRARFVIPQPAEPSLSSRVYNDLAVLLPLAFPQRSLIFVVQTSEVVDIEKRWVAVGRPKCAHERASSEFYLGSRTGDLACLDRGETWTRGEPVPPPRGD